MTTAENDNVQSGNDPFAFPESVSLDDDFADLFAPPSPEDSLTLLAVSLVEDPFATTRLDDGASPAGGASCLARYERASAAYLAACYSFEEDDDKQEILRLIAAYWLRKSRAFWLD